jgi:hypothetical protein
MKLVQSENIEEIKGILNSVASAYQDFQF